MTTNLYPSRHKQRDFFILDIFGSYKDDLASMEHPVFSLSKKPDFRLLEYEHNGNTIKIKPSYTGLATIFDKDILLYMTSSLIGAKNAGDPLSQTVRFTSYDYLVSVNKDTGGSQYKQMREALERLNGTVIQTNIKTNDQEITSEFGLIDSWQVIKEDKKGNAIAVEVELSKWFYNSIIGGEVLTIDPEYFRLKKPTERRLYELARKHCGNQIAWKISLDKLKNKLGTVTTLRKLRFNLKHLSESNHLPEYNISIDKDVVLISRKEPQKPNQIPEKLPQYVSKKELEKQARPGETYDQVKSRINNKDKIKGLKKAIARK